MSSALEKSGIAEQIVAEILRHPEMQGVDEEIVRQRLELAAVSHLSPEEAAREYLERYQQLPGNARLYQVTSDGRILVAGHGRVEEIRKDDSAFAKQLHTFINEGNLAHYLMGSPQTSEQNPQNATFKLGITNPHHAFTPHTHGTRHFVTSLGFSGCMLFDEEKGTTMPIKMLPGTTVDIPGQLPHAFYNRSSSPLVFMVVNAGLGIEHEEYAVTREIAQRRLAELAPGASRADIEKLILALETLERDFNSTQPHLSLSPDEKLARVLYQLAERLGTGN